MSATFDSFTKTDGTKVTKEELEKILYSPGDGVVPKRSLISSLLIVGKLKSGNVGNDLTLSCGEHNRLAGDSIIGKSLLSVLDLQNRMPNDKAVKTMKTERRNNK